MTLPQLQNADLQNKNILMRCDFNVAVDENGHAQEQYKILAAKESIDCIASQEGAKLALASHFGRPDGKPDMQYSLKPLCNDLERILGRRIHFVDDCISAEIPKMLAELPQGEILLLENVRFYKEEKENDASFAQKIAAPFGLFVNEAFSVSHRAHASVVGVAENLPSVAGLWLQKEVENLARVRDNIEHPAVAIIGGSKIETKLPLITQFEKIYDAVLIGGRVAVEAQEQKMTFSDKVFLPLDYTGGTLDIGPKTIALFSEKIASAKMIVWNGPMGKFEESPYDQGTIKLLSAVADSSAFSVIGGGESVQALEEQGMLEQPSFVSTGGGAMLAFLGGDTLPGLEVL